MDYINTIRDTFGCTASLRGRRLKGNGKGVLGARETREAREEKGRETPARRRTNQDFNIRLVDVKNEKNNGLLACVASVSVWFRSKGRPRNGILGFCRAKNETPSLLFYLSHFSRGV